MSASARATGSPARPWIKFRFYAYEERIVGDTLISTRIVPWTANDHDGLAPPTETP